MSLIKILYMDWFVLPMAVYISFGFVFLFYKGFDSTDRKKLLKRMTKVIVIILTLFYFIIPVPASVQHEYIENTHNLIKNNSNATLIHIQTVQVNYCFLPYLPAITYFQFKRAYLNDYEDIFQRKNGVLGGSISDHRIAPASEICKTNFM